MAYASPVSTGSVKAVVSLMLRSRFTGVLPPRHHPSPWPSFCQHACNKKARTPSIVCASTVTDSTQSYVSTIDDRIEEAKADVKRQWQLIASKGRNLTPVGPQSAAPSQQPSSFETAAVNSDTAGATDNSASKVGDAAEVQQDTTFTSTDQRSITSRLASLITGSAFTDKAHDRRDDDADAAARPWLTSSYMLIGVTWLVFLLQWAPVVHVAVDIVRDGKLWPVLLSVCTTFPESPVTQALQLVSYTVVAVRHQEMPLSFGSSSLCVLQ